MKAYGAEAGLFAWSKAEDCLEEGDLEGAGHWYKVADVIAWWSNTL